MDLPKRPLNLRQLLQNATRTPHEGGIMVYPCGNPSLVHRSYPEFQSEAIHASRIVSSLPNFEPGAPILIHLDDHSDTLLWFWAIVLADGLPVLSSPFSNVSEHRDKHIQNLSSLLESPLCITRAKFMSAFQCNHGIRIHTVESLIGTAITGKEANPEQQRTKNAGIALLMLTSGSTGNSKAVQFSDRQIMSAIIGKASVRTLPDGMPFLNWIGLDHAASLIEIHLQAMFLGVGQIHVHPSDIAASPLLFLDLLSRHQVARSFAPNSFLSKLVASEAKLESEKTDTRWDLRKLTILASGGEANDTKTCVAASSLLSRYGALPNVITTGFGMTETCAGCIFNLNCPSDDVEFQYAFASVGQCMDGVEMRVTVSDSQMEQPLRKKGRVGELEIRGDIVFSRYYRNEAATAEAFLPGGWFRTGDQAWLDSGGNLHLVGRLSENVIINGMKYAIDQLQATVDGILHADATVSVVFATRPSMSATEQIAIAYALKDWPATPDDILHQRNGLSSAIMASTNTQPIIFALENESLLPKSTLGKISRSKLRALFESGFFTRQINQYQQLVDSAYKNQPEVPMEEEEILLINDVADVLGIDSGKIRPGSSIFDLNIDSMSLIRLKRRLKQRLGVEVAVVDIMSSPSISGLAKVLTQLGKTKQYNPVVTLNSQGEKTPLWLIHPGVGEVLVFFGLSNQLQNRPVHALRARGFDGEQHFTDLDDMVTTYYEAVKSKQPNGPYALAGYSYGSMVAFEISKRLEKDGSRIQFLGVFNLPPHIKSRMRQLSWNSCFLHLSYFLGLITEQLSDQLEDTVRGLPKADAISAILNEAKSARMIELGLTIDSLSNWASLAHGLQSLAIDYEPMGNVSVTDIFHAIPLSIAARSRQDWVENHLAKWKDFTRSAPRFHEVGGAHYTMLGSEHVVGFAKTLERALEERGA